MSPIPAFEIGVWDAWILIIPFLLVTYGLSYSIVNKKAALFAWPPYSNREKTVLRILMATHFVSWVYCIFLPLKSGTAWLYTGLFIYLVGMIFITLATLNFATTSLDKPNTKGVYRISRHPMYFGWLLVLIGIGIACASWVFLLFAIAFAVLQMYIFTIPEERFCLEKYGDIYREYMNRTPRWIGIPKSS